MITLVKDTINNEDIDKLIEWLKTYPRLTKGAKTVELERKWSAWLGTKYSVFVNSGSSAVLLMIYTLIEQGHLLPGDKVVVPSLCWATDLSPIIQFGLKPILCDINMSDLSVDLKHLESIFAEDAPNVLLLVSILGLCPDMDKIQELCKKYKVFLLEDVCESTGTRYKNQKLGTFGLMSSFSCYFGHHFSTIEGGFISTNDKDTYNILKMLRSHGWNRDLDDESKEKWCKNGDDFNNLYKFFVPGFNLRSTDLQAFIGLGQIDKLDRAITTRYRNYQLYKKLIINNFWSPEDTGHYISNFAFPIIHPNRNKIVEKLKLNNIEVRPLVCGSMGTQPVYEERFGRLELPNASVVDKYGCYIPNHPELSRSELETIVEVVNKCIEEF